jgi:pilus assembly protein CpaF
MSLSERLASVQTEAAEKTGQQTRQAILDEVAQRIHLALIEDLGPDLYQSRRQGESLEKKITDKLGELIRTEPTVLTVQEKAHLTEQIIHDVTGYGPLEEFLNDKTITEIMVNNAKTIYVERGGKVFPTTAQFFDEGHLRRVIEKIVGEVGRRIDESAPMVDARLPDGSRVNAIIPPLAINGAKLTIRKFSADPFTVNDLINFGTLTPGIASFLEACVRGRLNVIISGGTGSGKTTLLNVLSSCIPSNERIITIEDSVELQLRQAHVLQLESRPQNIEGKGQVTIRDLVRNSLRMRPDRIVVGEVRGGEALDMLQAMNTGHDGSLTTVHANSPRDVLSRLETMVLMSGMELPLRAVREQVASAIDLIIHEARFRDGTRKVTHITEVQGMESDVITLQDVFLYDFSAGLDETGRFKGTIKPTGIRPNFMVKLQDMGITIPPDVIRFDTKG